MLFKTIPTSQITPNLYSVCTKYVNFYIYKDEKFTLCIDTGIGVSTIRIAIDRI